MQEIVIPMYMRENLLPPLYGTKHLRLKVPYHYCYSVVNAVDSLLWISPQLETLYIGHIGDLKSLITVLCVSLNALTFFVCMKKLVVTHVSYLYSLCMVSLQLVHFLTCPFILCFSDNSFILSL